MPIQKNEAIGERTQVEEKKRDFRRKLLGLRTNEHHSPFGIRIFRRIRKQELKRLGKPLSLLKLSLISIWLLSMLVTAGMFSFISLVITQADELELTNVWTYITELDADKTLRLQTDSSVQSHSGVSKSRTIRSNIDELLSYLDIQADEFKLANQLFKSKINKVHDQLWKLHLNAEDSRLTTQYLTQVVDWSEDLKQRLNLKLEVGLYSHLIELRSPFKEEKLQINQRYGYYVTDSVKQHFNGIKVQATEKEEVFSPLTGKVRLTEDAIHIESQDRQLIVTNILPLVSNDSEVKAGELIGRVSKENELMIEYSKKENKVNPSFYFPQVEYIEDGDEPDFPHESFDEGLFRRLILLNCHAFSDKATKIITEAKKNGLSPVIFAAVMIHESAWGTSQGIIEKNNPAGLMSENGLLSYSTLDEGIEATGRTLKNLIVDQQLTTIEQLGSVYSPVGADNDPTGLNNYWVSAIKQLMVQLGGSAGMSLLWQSEVAINQQLLVTAKSLYQTNVQYSQGSNRGVWPYHDCSSFVIWVLNELDIRVPLGNTDTLYHLEGTHLRAISYNEVMAGDLFIWGEKGQSAGDYGHTGFFLDRGGKTILHCTPASKKGFGQQGDIVITPFEGYYGDPQVAPVYFYRIVERNKE